MYGAILTGSGTNVFGQSRQRQRWDNLPADRQHDGTDGEFGFAIWLGPALCDVDAGTRFDGRKYEPHEAKQDAESSVPVGLLVASGAAFPDGLWRRGQQGYTCRNVHHRSEGRVRLAAAFGQPQSNFYRAVARG